MGIASPACLRSCDRGGRYWTAPAPAARTSVGACTQDPRGRSRNALLPTSWAHTVQARVIFAPYVIAEPEPLLTSLTSAFLRWEPASRAALLLFVVTVCSGFS